MVCTRDRAKKSCGPASNHDHPAHHGQLEKFNPLVSRSFCEGPPIKVNQPGCEVREQGGDVTRPRNRFQVERACLRAVSVIVLSGVLSTITIAVLWPAGGLPSIGMFVALCVVVAAVSNKAAGWLPMLVTEARGIPAWLPGVSSWSSWLHRPGRLGRVILNGADVPLAVLG